MHIEHLDHLVLTVSSIEHSVRFYVEVLGMKEIQFGKNRKALLFGNQKINLHEKGKEFAPKAAKPQPGSADLCFICNTPIAEVIQELQNKGIEIVEGPVKRTGATQPILSVYVRDPDQNLIEIANLL